MFFSKFITTHAYCTTDGNTLFHPKYPFSALKNTANLFARLASLPIWYTGSCGLEYGVHVASYWFSESEEMGLTVRTMNFCLLPYNLCSGIAYLSLF